jgi:chemotaxis protein MotA
VNLIIGAVIVIACVIGGFVMHEGKILALWQPTELIIIGGAAFGSFVSANGIGTVVKVFKTVLGSLRGAKYSKKHYMAVFALMYDLFSIARKDGVIGLEKEIDEPQKSKVFAKHPLVQKDNHAMEFITDYLRMMVSGDMNPFQLENLMDVELSTRHHESEEIASAVNKVSDALPGFGIVAAVLGIVNTMAALGGPVAEIGQKVAAALVGTFLGILLAYGFVGPTASALEKFAEEEAQFFVTIKTCIIAMVQGYPPQIAVEFGRKSTPSNMRPTFKELESHVRGKK